MRKDLYTNGSVDLPKITKKRSFFDLSHSSHIDMNPGILYPVDQVIEIVPGDTFDYSHKLNIRMTNPPKTPVMDQLVLDLYFFFCPNRIVWTNWDNFITDFSGSNYYTNFGGSYPTIQVNQLANGNTALFYSVLDFLGWTPSNIYAGNASLNPSLLPVRGYYLIWNEFFRFAPLQYPIAIDTNDTSMPDTLINPGGLSYYTLASSDSTNGYTAYSTVKYAGLSLMPVNRLPGFFSRCLPQPTINDVLINLSIPSSFSGSLSPVQGLFNADPGYDDHLITTSNPGVSYGSFVASDISVYNAGTREALLGFNNLYGGSIRDLSNAFALNKFLYIDNVYGKRITDWTYGHFGVNVPDSRVQRPEFLAKKRVYININQIMQSSETGTSPQGNAGAWSQTFDEGFDFVKSFTEYGFLFTLGCIRVLNHTFSQGIDLHWRYRTRYDYYLPEFNNVGDMAIQKSAIYVDPSYNSTFGYQERYAQYKMIPSRVAGYMRPQVSNTLAIWTYTDYYNTAPTLSASWMFEPKGNIERTMYINFSTAPGFILDYVADIKAYRSMPYNSLPGGLTGSW